MVSCPVSSDDSFDYEKFDWNLCTHVIIADAAGNSFNFNRIKLLAHLKNALFNPIEIDPWSSAGKQEYYNRLNGLRQNYPHLKVKIVEKQRNSFNFVDSLIIVN